VLKTELLSPAGSLRAMHLALAYGADAVYAGQPRFSLRVRNNEFDLHNLGVGVEQTHAEGKRFYVVANIAPHNSKINHFLAELAPVVELGPDALIVSDPGVIWLVRQQFPDMPLHLSVQANTLNWAAVRFWQEQGIARIILSRELAIEEIAEIRQRVPDMELEVFVHGALCMAYSGRCLLSGYFNKRDPNQGACTNACRWNYKVHQAQEDAVGQWEAAPVLLEDPQRPGELLPMDEDEHGSYIMNSRDLRALEYVEQLVSLGVHSLKIEGRTKSPYYAARTAQVYRQAIDSAVAGKPLQVSLFEDLDGLANRGYTPGFLRRHIPARELQNYDVNHSSGSQQWVGEMCSEQAPLGYVWVDVKNRFQVGDKLLLLSPEGNVPFTLEEMLGLDGSPIFTAPGSGHRVALRLPVDCDTSTALLVRLL
jgi:U32 family peptidase